MCGAQPDLWILAPCCVLILAAIAWAMAALGAVIDTVLRTGEHGLDSVLVIAGVGALVMALAHALPGPVALVVAAVMSAHTAVIAAVAISPYCRRATTRIEFGGRSGANLIPAQPARRDDMG